MTRPSLTVRAHSVLRSTNPGGVTRVRFAITLIPACNLFLPKKCTRSWQMFYSGYPAFRDVDKCHCRFCMTGRFGLR
jgi:hypothetical protein